LHANEKVVDLNYVCFLKIESGRKGCFSIAEESLTRFKT